MFKRKLNLKKQCFKDLQICDSEENWVKYRLAKKEAKRVVSITRANFFEEFYKELGTKDGKQKMYRITKIKEQKSRDLDQVMCVKDEEGNVLVKDESIRDRWKNYFYNLFNDRVETLNYTIDDLGNIDRNSSFTDNIKISISEVEDALKRMAKGKAVGPDGIPIEVWKCLGEDGVW